MERKSAFSTNISRNTGLLRLWVGQDARPTGVVCFDIHITLPRSDHRLETCNYYLLCSAPTYKGGVF